MLPAPRLRKSLVLAEDPLFPGVRKECKSSGIREHKRLILPEGPSAAGHVEQCKTSQSCRESREVQILRYAQDDSKRGLLEPFFLFDRVCAVDTSLYAGV